MSEPQNSSKSPRLRTQVLVATLSRLVINTSRRFLYPFAPALSRGLGVPLTSVTSLIALNQVTGLLSPLFGPLSDRRGYRVTMLTGLGLLAAGMLAAGLLPVYAMVAAGIFLGGLTKALYDPALQAYVGERVTYERRGLVIGLIEMSWAGAALVGIPLVGLLIDRLGWRSPFIALGALALLSMAGLAWVIPSDSPKKTERVETGFAPAWQLLKKSRAAIGVLLFGFFISMANDNLFVVYGAWLETGFGLGLVALGSATTVIGIAELTGETMTATLSDRLGLKRSVIIGAILSSAGYALLPIIGQTLPLALVGLFIAFITFEFTMVTTFSLVTEVLPRARATMMASFLAAASLGRVAGALTGGPFWVWGGMATTGTMTALISGVGVVCFLWGMRGRRGRI